MRGQTITSEVADMMSVETNILAEMQECKDFGCLPSQLPDGYRIEYATDLFKFQVYRRLRDLDNKAAMAGVKVNARPQPLQLVR